MAPTPTDRPAAVLLDAGGTLFHEHPSRAGLYARAARDFGLAVDEARVARAMDEVHAVLPREIEGAYRYSEGWFRVFITEVFARLGHVGDPEPVQERLLADFRDPRHFRLFDDVHAALARLRGARVPMAVVSNWGPPLPGLLARLGVARHFRAVLVSAVLRREKPDPGLFRSAAESLGIEPRLCVHVGDRFETDVVGAHRAGMRALLLRRGTREPPDVDVEMIASLEDIPPLFGLARP